MATRTSAKNSAEEKSRSQSTSKKKKISDKRVAKKVVSTKPAESNESNNGQLTLMLDTVLVINNASSMHAKMSSFLKKSNDKILIDASMVEMIDTAMIQLLLSLVIGLKSKNVEIIWRSPSSEFVNRVRSLGLAEIFGIDCLVEG